MRGRGNKANRRACRPDNVARILDYSRFLFNERGLNKLKSKIDTLRGRHGIPKSSENCVRIIKIKNDW